MDWDTWQRSFHRAASTWWIVKLQPSIYQNVNADRSERIVSYGSIRINQSINQSTFTMRIHRMNISKNVICSISFSFVTRAYTPNSALCAFHLRHNQSQPPPLTMHDNNSNNKWGGFFISCKFLLEKLCRITAKRNRNSWKN